MEQIFRKYYKALMFFAGKFIPQDECHDVVIEAIIKVPLNDEWNDKQTSVFLYQSVKNACIDWLRADRRHWASHKEILYLSGDVQVEMEIDTSIAETITLADMLAAIAQMAPKTREVMNRCIKGQSSQEIAARMGIKTRTVLNLKAWGKKHLKDMLETGKSLADITSRVWDTEGLPIEQIKNREKNRMRKREIAAAKKQQKLAIG